MAGTSAEDDLGKLQIMGALSLHLNFINLSQMILSRFGQLQKG